jgi:hypothetical protein
MPPISPEQTSLRAAIERDWYFDGAIEFGLVAIFVIGLLYFGRLIARN